MVVLFGDVVLVLCVEMLLCFCCLVMSFVGVAALYLCFACVCWFVLVFCGVCLFIYYCVYGCFVAGLLWLLFLLLMLGFLSYEFDASVYLCLVFMLAFRVCDWCLRLLACFGLDLGLLSLLWVYCNLHLCFGLLF